MFGQNGLLYDSNVVGVLAARGLERNSFPSHSFSWHLSPSPTADPPPLPPPPASIQPLSLSLLPAPDASLCRQRGSSGHYSKLSRLTVTWHRDAERHCPRVLTAQTCSRSKHSIRLLTPASSDTASSNLRQVGSFARCLGWRGARESTHLGIFGGEKVARVHSRPKSLKTLLQKQHFSDSSRLTS